MTTFTLKDIGVSLVIATLGAMLSQWLWIALCGKFPEPMNCRDASGFYPVIFDDRPLILNLNWNITSKVLLFACSFIYTFSVALISRTAKSARKDWKRSLVIAFVATIVSQCFWLACEAHPLPDWIPAEFTLSQLLSDDRPLVIVFNAYFISKILLFILTFAFTFGITQASRKVWRSKPVHS